MYADDSALGLLDVAAPSAAPTTSPRVPPIDVHPPGNLGNAAEAEADITMNITLREEYVARLDKLLSTASKAQLQKRLMKSLDLLDMLRMVTVDIIEAVVQWRHGLPKPFVWKGENYLLKITHDCDFLDNVKPLVKWLGFTMKRNPFFTLRLKLRGKGLSDGAGKLQQKLLLAPIGEEKLRAAEDALRREEIHHAGGGKMVVGREFGGRRPTPRGSKAATKTGPTVAALGNGLELGEELDKPPSEVLIADRLRRKLVILNKRPNTRKKLIAMSRKRGENACMKREQFLRIIIRNGIALTDSEEDWILRYFDPREDNRIKASNVLRFLEIPAKLSADWQQKNAPLADGNQPLNFSPEETSPRDGQRYTIKQLDEIAQLENEMQDLLQEISKAEDEAAWWEHQREWEEATVRSVVARRARLQRTQKEIDKRFKEVKEIKKEIAKRKRRIHEIKMKTRVNRKDRMKEQKEKSTYQMYGGKDRYEEKKKWESDKRRIKLEMKEREDRRLKFLELDRHKRLAEQKRKKRERNLAALEIQRIARGRRGRIRAKRIYARKARREEEKLRQEHLAAIKMQKIARGKKAREAYRQKIHEQAEKRAAALKIQKAQRTRKRRKKAKRELKRRKKDRDRLDLEFKLDPDRFVHPLLWDEEAATEHSHAQQVILFVSGDMSTSERLGFLHSLVKLVPDMFKTVKYPVDVNEAMEVLGTGLSCLVHAEIGLSASTRSHFNANVSKAMRAIKKERDLARREALNRGHSHGDSTHNSSILDHPMPKVIIVAGWHSVGYCGKFKPPEISRFYDKHMKASKESDEDSVEVARLDVGASSAVHEEHLKEYLEAIETSLSSIYFASSSKQFSYSEQLNEMLRPASSALPSIIFVLEALGILMDPENTYTGPTTSGNIGAGFGVFRSVLEGFGPDAGSNVAIALAEHLRHVHIADTSKKNAEALRKYTRSARWKNMNDLGGTVFQKFVVYIENATNYLHDMYKRGGKPPSLKEKCDGGKSFDRVVLLHKQPKIADFPPLYMAACHVISTMLHDHSMLRAGRNVPEILHDETSATYEGVKISMAHSRRPGLMKLHHTIIQDSTKHQHNGGRIFVEFFDLDHNLTYFTSVSEKALGRLIAPPLIENARGVPFKSLQAMYSKIVETATMVGHHSKYRPNPDLALLRHQHPVVRCERRVFELQSPRGIGQLAMFKVWEGGPGDLVIDAYLVHKKVACHCGFTWYALRTMLNFGIFTSFASERDLNAIRSGNMKEMAHFVLGRMAFEDNQIWLRTDDEDKDKVMLLRYLGDCTINGQELFAVVYSGRNNWLVQVLLPLQTDGKVSRPLLAMIVKHSDVASRAKHAKLDAMTGEDLLDWIKLVPVSEEVAQRKERSRAGISKMRSPREIGVTDAALVALQLKRIPSVSTSSLPRLLVVEATTTKDEVLKVEERKD
jgi:hypothetical protein